MIDDHFILKIQRGLFTACLCVCLFTSSLAFSETAYIPVQSGQTLLQIAKKAHPNYSVSIQQLAYAIYKLNPDAFDNNMNALKQGSKLRLPEKNKVLDLSKSLANKKITQHEHDILILRASAKRLSAAKKRYHKHKKKVRSIRSELAKHKHKSTNWNLVYLKFVTARRAEKKAARNVKKQRKALVTKTELSKNKPPIPKPSISESSNLEASNIADSSLIEATEKADKDELKEDPALVNVREKISELQAQVQLLSDAKTNDRDQYEQEISHIKNELDTSKQQLVAKTNEQEVIIHRVDVLENDQAAKEKIILSLQSSLNETAKTVKQQQTRNQELLKQMQTLSADTYTLKQQQEQRLKVIRAAEALEKASEIQVKEDAVIPKVSQLTLVKSSLDYWKDRIKERPLIAFSIIGSLLVLLLFSMIKRQRARREETMKTINQLESTRRSSPINNRKITV